MAGKRQILSRRIKFFLKYLLLVTAIFLLCLYSHLDRISGTLVLASTAGEITQPSADPLRSEARSLTQQGHEQLAQGKAEEALKTWERATEIYTQLGYTEGINGSKINQSLALQTLGQYRHACQILLTALTIDSNNEICEPSAEGNQPIPEEPKSLVSAIGLRTLGDVLMVIGKLELSEMALEQSLKIAQSLQSSPEIRITFLSLGNTIRAQYNRKRDLFDRTNSSIDRDNAKELANKAIDLYHQAIQETAELSTSNIVPIQAKLNRLSLLLDFEGWLQEIKQNSEAEKIKPAIQSQMADLWQNEKAIANLPTTQSKVYLYLNFAQSLSRFNQNHLAMQYAQTALQQARVLQNRRAESYVLGTIGGFYEQTQELSPAEKLTKQALGLVQAIDAVDIAYQWQWQLGRINQKQGRIKDAIAAYDAALKNLNLVRKNLLPINADAQFSFRNNIKPIYQQYLELLLQPPAILQSENLDKATKVSDSLQLAELENFIKCDLADLDSIENAKEPPAAIIYPIIFKDRVEVIVKLPQPEKLPAKLYHYTTQVRQEDFQKHLYALQSKLGDKNNIENTIIPHAQKLYDWLFREAANNLPASGTLMFILDSELQSIPMAVLHDGKQYLIKKYSIAVSSVSQLPKVNRLKSGQWSVLLAGVSEKADSFPPNLPILPGVKTELKEIGKKISHQQLLNQQFTFESFRQQVNETSFPVIHLATHGQFSSDPDKTFIYSWNKKINVKELDEIIQTKGQTNSEPINLLVLSACETAKGDKQAALGIAGVALKAKARSTVASLWKVGDGSTATFMSQFYDELNQGATKAEALRKVQVSFIHNPNFQHPYDWAAFILAGNWQ